MTPTSYTYIPPADAVPAEWLNALLRRPVGQVNQRQRAMGMAFTILADLHGNPVPKSRTCFLWRALGLSADAQPHRKMMSAALDGLIEAGWIVPERDADDAAKGVVMYRLVLPLGVGGSWARAAMCDSGLSRAHWAVVAALSPLADAHGNPIPARPFREFCAQNNRDPNQHVLLNELVDRGWLAALGEEHPDGSRGLVAIELRRPSWAQEVGR